jgi:hypothetical protein
MILKQWIPEGGEEDFVEPEFENEEIFVVLEPEIMEFVYVYVPFPTPFLGMELRCAGGRGMHIEATWHRLTDGTWYMDQVTV